ncbi:hypothetical protein [Streptomyces xanthochromogenes]|uniref:hypothetical protein n=1 Tax=Streptomyces xanthochromogenes TaxID=67384 RepID=UPI0034267BBA
MRSLLRIAVATATLLLLGMAVAPGAAHAVNGDERIAQMRLRVVDAVNEGTVGEIQRLRAAVGGGSDQVVARLEARLRHGWQLAADLRSVRVPGAGHARGAGTSTSPGASASAGHSGVGTPVGGPARSATAQVGESSTGSATVPAAGSATGSMVQAATGAAVVPAVYSVDPSAGSVGGSPGGASDRDSGGDNAFEAARAALPDTPVGVLSLIGGGALALVGGGLAAAVVRRPYGKE